jgi:hypothetical protein
LVNYPVTRGSNGSVTDVPILCGGDLSRECLGRYVAGNRTAMTDDPGTRGENTDTDSDTDQTLHMTSGADVLRRAGERANTDADEPVGAQEPPD